MECALLTGVPDEDPSELMDTAERVQLYWS